MKSLKEIVGENLVELRKAAHLTQFELAEKMNYSDKTISKWENGDTLPDLETLNELCKFYGVTIDYLTHEVHENKADYIINNKTNTANNIAITCLMCSLVWMISTIVFVYGIVLKHESYWTVFVYSIPVTCIVAAFFTKKYFKTTRKVFFIFGTILIWSILASVFCGFIYHGYVLWPLFLLGIPAEVSLALWSFIKQSKPSK